jgi:hypothetical protein
VIIQNIPVNKTSLREKVLPQTAGKVVINRNLMPLIQKFPNNMTADITRSTDDQYIHTESIEKNGGKVNRIPGQGAGILTKRATYFNIL